jgi:hypothetical protein
LIVLQATAPARSGAGGEQEASRRAMPAAAKVQDFMGGGWGVWGGMTMGKLGERERNEPFVA